MLKFPPSVWVRPTDDFGNPVGQGWIHRKVEGHDKERRVALALAVESIAERRRELIAKGFYIGFTCEEVKMVSDLKWQAEQDAYAQGKGFNEDEFYRALTVSHYEASNHKGQARKAQEALDNPTAITPDSVSMDPSQEGAV